MSRGSRDNNSILSELEWDEGLSMPVANAENKALEDEVKCDLQNHELISLSCSGQVLENIKLDHFSELHLALVELQTVSYLPL